MVYEYEYDEDSQKIRINCLGSVHGSSIEDFPIVMAKTIDHLMELNKVARIVLADVREYEYDFSESKMLLEIALVVENIINEKESLNVKYHTKTAEQIMEVLNSAEANAKAKNFDLNAAELFLSANKGITIHRARRKRDFGSRLKMTNIQVVLREKVK